MNINEGLPKFVWNRDHNEKGTVVGVRRCTLEGCRGRCVAVKWPKGNKTWPCLRGCKPLGKTGSVWQIL